MSYKQKLEQYREELEGWGFSLSSPKVPRADFTNVHPYAYKPTYQWDHYSGLPGVEAYMER